MKVLVTGANGFVGSSLCNELLQKGYDVTIATRSKSEGFHGFKKVRIDSIDAQTNWAVALKKVDIVIHLAARVHMMVDEPLGSLAEYRETNKHGALNLAEQAVEAGVKRFIFLSTVKVNGDFTDGMSRFSPDDDCITRGSYALSKYEAEQALSAIAKITDMELVIIRPPLVYGPNVRANFASMMKWVNSGFPLPLGAVHNRRSLVALDNLVSFIIHCIDHPKAVNEVFLISDGEDVSTTELLKKVAKALDKRVFLLPIPVNWMKFVAKLVGKADVADRLFGSLQVDSSKTQELLGWKPIITMDEQLKKIADAYLNEKIV